MLSEEHSIIRQVEREHIASKSDLQSLHELRELLPNPVNLGAYSNTSFSEGRQEMLQEKEEGKDLMLKVTQQAHQLLQTREQLYYFKTEFFRLVQQNTILNQSLKNSKTKQSQTQKTLEQQLSLATQQQKKQKQTQNILKTKQAELEALRSQLQKVKHGVSKVQVGGNGKQLQEKIMYQSRLLLDLANKNEQILKINALLKEQLELAECKLIQLEQQLQQHRYGLLHHHLSKLKENHNLINHKNNLPLHYQTLGHPNQHGHPHPAPTRNQPIINTHRQNAARQTLARESKTVQKDKIDIEVQRIKPLKQPKPHRKVEYGQLYGRERRRQQRRRQLN